MPDVFISYSRLNMDAANAFAELLRSANLDVFIDYERMQGDNFPARIAQEIENSRFLLFLVSKDSTASKWVKREVQYADRKNITTIVLRLDDAELPHEIFFLGYLDYIDATRWIATAPIPATVTDKLGRALNVTLKGGAPPPAPAPRPVAPPSAASAPTGPVFTVSKLGAADFRSITEALAKVPEGATIKVKPGLYRESVKLTKAVELIGDGHREDILIESADGNVLWMDTDFAAVRGLSLRQTGTPEAQKVAVYIPKGRLILEDCDITSSSLAGIQVCNAGTNPVIRRCRIHNGNSAGVLAYEKASGTFEDCEMVGNGLSGIQVTEGANPTLRRCRMVDNIASGLLVLQNATGIFEDCEMVGNGLSGFEAKTGANPILRRCRMVENKTGGVLVSQNAAGIFEDCHIVNNGFSDKNYPGVEIREAGNPTLRGCTISVHKGPGIYAHTNARGTVEHCDLRGNGLKGAFEIDATSQLIRRNNQEA
ncbi:MAG: right-handed parallel beta-helix repeat-containing protein [Anaerolineae bacterium]|nr:right-handed parallel beta-helix repeat-containing protein [Anaerolineae bacterium]